MDSMRNTTKYSPGVLVGNWYEDMRVREDKVAFYRSKFSSTDRFNGSEGEATQSIANATSLVELKDVVVLGKPIQIVSVATDAVLAIDTTPQLSPNPNQCLVTAGIRGQPQIRSTWVIQRAQDENNQAYTHLLKEENVLHYGQRIRIANEDAHPDGFYYLHSELHGRGRSGKQPLTASLGATKDNIFVIARPGEKRDDIRDGGVVEAGDSVVLYHAATNQPLRCSKATQKTSFGYEHELSCSFVTGGFSRSLSAVTGHPENLFVFSGTAATLRNALSSKTDRGRSMTLSMSLGIGLDSIVSRIREGALHFGGRLGFRVLSKAMGTACNEHRVTFVDRQQVFKNVRLMGVLIQPLELDVIFKKFDRQGNGVIVAQEFLREVRIDMPSIRIDAVVKSFQLLTVEGGGSVDFNDMLNLFRYNSPEHPDVKEGIISCEEAIFDFLNAWPGMNKTTTVTLDTFLAYYTDISPAVESDARFIDMVQRCWDIPSTDEYKTRRPRRAVEVLHTDETAETIYLPDSLVVDTRDKKTIQGILIQHGVKEIKDISVRM